MTEEQTEKILAQMEKQSRRLRIGINTIVWVLVMLSAELLLISMKMP